MYMMPSRTCCGCCSLTAGIESICLVMLLVEISVLSSVTSKGDIDVFGHAVSPTTQCAVGAWTFFGILLTISSGVGMLFRLEMPLRAFFCYLSVSFVGGVLVPMVWLLSGSMCDKMVKDDVQALGSSFVCGFTDSLFFFFMLVLGASALYVIYMVWSAAEEIAASPFPELIKYSDALKNVYVPDAPTTYQWSMGNPRGAALQPNLSNPGLMKPSFGMMPPPQTQMGYGGTGEQA